MTDELLNHKTTTITTRVWCAEDIEHARKLILEHADLLTPELLEVARLAKTEDGGFPRWLVHGLAARHFRSWLEARLVGESPAMTEEPVTKTEKKGRR